MTRILWRILMAVLCVFLILFAAAQYNDPDPQIWAVMYSIGAIWTGVAAFAPRLISRARCNFAFTDFGHFGVMSPSSIFGRRILTGGAKRFGGTTKKHAKAWE